MTVLERMKLRLPREPDENVFKDYIESAQAAICNRRFPFGSTLTQREEYLDGMQDLVFRCAYAMYLKRGGEYESSHTENGVSRSWTSEGIPTELLSEVVPLVGTF